MCNLPSLPTVLLWSCPELPLFEQLGILLTSKPSQNHKRRKEIALDPSKYTYYTSAEYHHFPKYAFSGVSPNALAHLRQAKIGFGSFKCWINSSGPQAIVKWVMAAVLPYKRKSLLARACEKEGIWGDLTISPGVTTPLMQGTGQITNTHESAVLGWRGAPISVEKF